MNKQQEKKEKYYVVHDYRPNGLDMEEILDRQLKRDILLPASIKAEQPKTKRQS